MNDADFDELLQSARSMVAFEQGEASASRVWRYEGAVLVEIVEAGVTTWRLADVSLDADAASDAEGAPDAARIRAALRQTQQGFAALLGVPLGTVRGWEQHRRTPRGPAARLLRVAARRPGALLESV